jgi:NADH:ubiquinone oxidoreductase subunit 6 (subunit J)
MSIFAILISVLAVMAALILGVMGLNGLSRPGADRRRAVLMLLVSIITLLNLYLWLTSPSRAPGPAQAETAERIAGARV